MGLVVIVFYICIACLCYSRLPFGLGVLYKLFLSLLWPLTFLFFWGSLVFQFSGNKIQNSVRNASSDVAIAGAQSCLDKVEGFISNYPNVREWIVKSSHHAMALRLSNQFRIDLCEDFLFSPPHNYEFHRAAYEVKALAGQYQKNSMEWAASLILMAAFSLLGSEPSVERDVQWKRIVKMWHPVIYKPDNDKIVAWYDPRSEMLWIRDS